MSLTFAASPWLASSAVVRGERDNLVRFWLACPDDVLEPLWNGTLGQATREMVAQLTPTTFFTDQQITLRNQLGQFLQGGFQQPGAIKVVIATFLLSPPGQFKIVNPKQHLPGWLVSSYQSLYEVVQPSATPISQSLQDSHVQSSMVTQAPTHDFPNLK